MAVIRTVGHGTLAADELVTLLRHTGVDLVVDVRRYPGSRRHPQFGRDAMASWLGDAGVAYEWIEALGGRRATRPDSRNVALRNEQFRGYADHMATPEFAAGVVDLRRLAGERSAAVMCSESVWWRCHRRLLADHLVLVTGDVVEHVFHDERLTRHEPTAEARVVEGSDGGDGRGGGFVVYDAPEQPPLFEP